MVTHLETFRIKEFPIGEESEYEFVYKKVKDVFVLDGALVESIMQLIQQIRQKKTQSKQNFQDCLIFLANRTKDIGVCRNINVKECHICIIVHI
jgi:hypothetical protein